MLAPNQIRPLFADHHRRRISVCRRHLTMKGKDLRSLPLLERKKQLVKL
jgi:hypothetical protein